jgi:hypothetical protein
MGLGVGLLPLLDPCLVGLSYATAGLLYALISVLFLGFVCFLVVFCLYYLSLILGTHFVNALFCLVGGLCPCWGMYRP